MRKDCNYDDFFFATQQFLQSLFIEAKKKEIHRLYKTK